MVDILGIEQAFVNPKATPERKLKFKSWTVLNQALTPTTKEVPVSKAVISLPCVLQVDGC
jgi:hypothetical protein